MQYVPSRIKDDTRRMNFLQLVNINATKNTIGITYIRDSIEKANDERTFELICNCEDKKHTHLKANSIKNHNKSKN